MRRTLLGPAVAAAACAAARPPGAGEPGAGGPDVAACAAAFGGDATPRVAVAVPDPARALGVCLFEPAGRTVVLGSIARGDGGWRVRWRDDARLDAPIDGEQLASVQLDLVAITPGERAVRVDLDVEVGFDRPWRRTLSTRLLRVDDAGRLVEILAIASVSTRTAAGEVLEEHRLRPAATATAGHRDLEVDRVRTAGGAAATTTERHRWAGDRYRRAD